MQPDKLTTIAQQILAPTMIGPHLPQHCKSLIPPTGPRHRLREIIQSGISAVGIVAVRNGLERALVIFSSLLNVCNLQQCAVTPVTLMVVLTDRDLARLFEDFLYIRIGRLFFCNWQRILTAFPT